MELPKALIPVGSKTLLAHALAFADRLAPSEITVVGGFQYDRVAAELERLRLRAPIALCRNPDFREGNLLSLMAARPRVADDFLLLNVDHIFRAAIARVVEAPVEDVTAFIDTDRKLGDDDM